MTVDAIIDAGFDYVATADRLFILAAAPTSYTDADTNALATVPLTPGVGNGDWIVRDNTEVGEEGNGRELVLAAQTGTAGADGNNNYVAFGVSGSTTLVLGESGAGNEIAGDGDPLTTGNGFTMTEQIVRYQRAT